MDNAMLKGLWRRLGVMAGDLHKAQYDLLMAVNFNKQLIEENDRLQTELLKLKKAK